MFTLGRNCSNISEEAGRRPRPCCDVASVQGEKEGGKNMLNCRRGGGSVVEKLPPPATLRVARVIRSPFSSAVLIDDHSLFRTDAP